MAANQSPIFTLTPKIGRKAWTSSTTANTKSDGAGTIGTDILLVFTGGTNGSFLNRVRLSPYASAAGTATTPTVARLYLSTQTSSTTTAADTSLFAEAACPAQTADQATTATNFIEIPCGFYIPSTISLLVSMHHAAAANTGWQFIAFYGDY
jgi:hypothetical protein